MTKEWNWIWPPTGPTPIREDSESEMFDSDSYPYTETFVREAIQNSLDARLDENKPVLVRISFNEGRLGNRESFLKRAIEFRDEAGLRVPEDWKKGKVKWVNVEDSNTKGLLGGLDNRKSDFWNYWLNFGKSNKSVGSRGGRGIGRITFLIASQISTVIAITRRHDDFSIAGCGMCVLKADEYGAEYRSTHAYLAESIADSGSIYGLHHSEGFHQKLVKAFEVAPYDEEPELTGLSLIVPYPHDDLTSDGILGSVLDHFAPAILDGSLEVEVDVDRLDSKSIAELAPFLAKHIHSKAIKQDVARYIDMIQKGIQPPSLVIKLPAAKPKQLSELRDDPVALKLRKLISEGNVATFTIGFSMLKKSTVHDVTLTVVARETPYGKQPIDRLFREGMSLPDVRSFRPGDIDLIILIDDPVLAEYLNLCEGKAHLDLLESMEVKQKIADAGFDGVQVKRLIKNLPDELREFLSEDTDKPDTSVLEGFFAIHDPKSERKKVPSGDDDDKPPPPPPPPPPNVPAIVVSSLEDGFELSGNAQYTKFPATVKARVAYADGTRSPAWSKFDFEPKDLKIEYHNCSISVSENLLVISDFEEDSGVKVCGFDARRELDVRIRTESNASED